MKEPPGRTVIVWSARAFYAVIVLLATLTALEPEWDVSAALTRLAGAFGQPIGGRDVIDGLRNLVLFAGWGAVWVVTARRDQQRSAMIRAATLTGAALSLLVESAQLFSPIRNASVIDLMTNTGGAFAGAMTLTIATSAVAKRRGARSFVGIPAFIFAGAWMAATALEALVPLFRQERIQTAYGGLFSRLGEAFAQFDPTSIATLPLWDLVIFFPAGVFGVMALVEYGESYRSAALRVILAGMVLFVGVEVTRGATSQPIIAGAALVHILGIALGALAAVRWLPGITGKLRGPDRPRALLGAYALWLAFWTWRPFIPDLSIVALRAELSLTRFIPLTALGGRVDLFSVIDVLRGFCLLLPVGAMLAVWPLRRAGWLAGPLPAIYLALVLELGQIPISGRFFDITDALIGVAGALIGWAVVRRSGFTPYGELMARQSAVHPGARTAGL
jgi:glycopeptide antibiotics resistance protein